VTLPTVVGVTWENCEDVTSRLGISSSLLVANVLERGGGYESEYDMAAG
jgi:hypothetical protein